MTTVSSLVFTNDNSVQSTTTTITGISSAVPVYALTTFINKFNIIN
jgi:hypothetical protein